MKPFTSPIASDLDHFLGHKRSLGFVYGLEERLLGELDKVALRTTGTQLDEALVRRFVTTGCRSSRAHRLSLVRQFARFLAREASGTFVPPRRYLGVRRQRPVLRVLSREEAGRFLCACAALTGRNASPHRQLIHGTALRTLLLTGLRRGELLALTRTDVDLEDGVLAVHDTKFGKSRYVPVAMDLTRTLRAYDDELDARIPGRNRDAAFFPAADGRHACNPERLYGSFRRVLAIAGIKHGGRGEGPRLHDLRHSFAVLRLLAWYEQDVDLPAKLPLLATYLGHVGLASTEVYLHMTHDLVGEVGRRMQSRFGDIITAEVTP